MPVWIFQLISLGFSIAVKAPQYIAEYQEVLRRAESEGEAVLESDMYKSLKAETDRLLQEIAQS